MYCKNCGNELNEGIKFCNVCGTPVQDVSNNPSFQSKSGANILSMVVVFVLTIIIAISPFTKMYYIDIFEKTDFSVSDIVNTSSEVYETARYLGINVNSDNSSSYSSRNDNDSSLGGLIILLIIFDFVMLLIGFLELVVELIYLVSTKEDSYGKFWKATISASVAFWISNLIMWIGVMYINASVREGFSSYNIDGVNIMGANVVYYILQAVAITAYIISNNKYSVWKKSRKNS